VEKLPVALLFGGRSAEHEVSVRSARNVAALLLHRYEPVLVYLSREGRWSRTRQVKPFIDSGMDGCAWEPVFVLPDRGFKLIDAGSLKTVGSAACVYPVLHGPYGEDGTVQGMLKLFDVPFVGADVTGSAAGIDKDVMKRLLREAGVPVPRFAVYEDYERASLDFDRIREELGVPLFVKPANMGSSVGIRKVGEGGEFAAAVAEAFKYDTKIIIEESVSGREIECSVLGNRENPEASLPGEIRPAREFYSYESKYVDEDGAELIIPADLSDAEIARIRELAIQTFRVLCCHGMARVDLFLREGRKSGPPDVLVNEINTLPGFTDISMYPKLWEASGVGGEELVDRLIGLAFERHRRESSLNTTREKDGN